MTTTEKAMMVAIVVLVSVTIEAVNEWAGAKRDLARSMYANSKHLTLYYECEWTRGKEQGWDEGTMDGIAQTLETWREVSGILKERRAVQELSPMQRIRRWWNADSSP